MNLITKAKLAAHVVRWVLTWKQRDFDLVPEGPVSQKFVSARTAAALISDGDVIFVPGIVSCHRNAIMYWAIRERFDRTAHPRDLTVISVGAQGGRGRVPGTIDDIAVSGLLKRQIGGHVETHKAVLRLADAGALELHVLPQGVEAALLEAHAAGADSVVTDVGVGTFLDPRVGRGSAVTPSPELTLVTAEADKLRCRMPAFDVTLITATAADVEGNLYMKNACMVTETRAAVRAARRRGARVIAQVAEVIQPDSKTVFIEARDVDAIVWNPYAEQAASFRQRRPLLALTEGAQVDVERTAQKLRFFNQLLGITPRRTKVDEVLARLGAWTFARFTHPPALINVGVGHPEEVARVLVGCGLADRLTFTTEFGVYNGLPAPGFFFGAAIAPERLISSAEMFEVFRQKLDVAVLGMLEADSAGNVNVSNRGDRVVDYVGPGGFLDISRHARTIIFVGSAMAGGKINLHDGQPRILQAGKPKLVQTVREVTFSGAEALKRGQTVLYVTSFGVLRLTEEGMRLEAALPGVDIQRDIVDASPMRIIVPPAAEITPVPIEVITGRGFGLDWRRRGPERDAATRVA